MKKQTPRVLNEIREYLYLMSIVFFALGFFFTMAKMLWESPIENSFVLMLMGGMGLITSEIIRRKVYEKKTEAG